MADIGLGQRRIDGRDELALITIGSDLAGPLRMRELFPHGWTARQALEFISS
jgi:hypothetical protein